jgi:quercetin dioxygenase-like cupin family protein
MTGVDVSIINGAVLSFLGIIVTVSIVRTRRGFKTIEKINKSMNIFIDDHDLDVGDFEFKDGGETLMLSQLTESAGNVKLIGEEYNKGYNFIVSDLPAGYTTPIHRHSKSDEFFYIISGKVDVGKCKSGICVYDNACEERKVMSAGDYFFVKHKHYHCVTALKDSHVIVVAMPPLFKRAAQKFVDRVKKLLGRG